MTNLETIKVRHYKKYPNVLFAFITFKLDYEGRCAKIIKMHNANLLKMFN
jgi:hypothetical protein